MLWLLGDLSKEGNPAAGIGDEAGGLAPSIHTAVLGDSAGKEGGPVWRGSIVVVGEGPGEG